tara:strand:+ start:5907 stop:6857 length:951 start_codon:yes stop_codon:yes gene_type:complete
MNVLSLFDGMSCGRIALERAGINVTSYHASELDKYAIQVTQANWPDTVQLGDVTQWREWDIDWKGIDLLIGGSPCQGFSFAGKQLAFDDPRSQLFFVYLDILNHIKSLNPDVKFMLENVKMKKEYLDVISRVLGVEPVFIDSQLVSAQRRQRFYWANWSIKQPEDTSAKLKDILETGIIDRDKAYALTARYYKAGNFNRYATKSSDQIIFELFGLSETCIAKFNRYGVRFLNHDTKIAKPLTAGDYGKLGKYGNYLKSLECETQIRKLTPIECERLQTVEDNYTNHVSNTQRYKMLGNGWTVDVIAHIFTQGLKNA